MEVVIENQGESRPTDSVVEPGREKQRDSDRKTVGDEPKSIQENGARVSENVDEKVKVNVGDTDVMSGDDVGGKNLHDSGNLEDSDMNGVSTLLKMKQYFVDKENTNPSNDVDSGKGTSVHEEGEDDEEEEHGFQVGDFVWGKIKSHPWWPGQIYDSSDASELALKMKQKSRLLVAYFGDGTFAWCRPSQVKSFEGNFKEFSGISTSKGFANAVDEAVEEMGRQVAEKLGVDRLARRVAVNAGIKEGVHIPDVRREILSSFSFEPVKILGDVAEFAKTLAFSDLLELEVLKGKLSGFYWFRGRYSLVKYHEAEPISGLEDKDEEQSMKLHGSRSSNKRKDGINPNESHRKTLEQVSGFPEHRVHHRRKQKSIAEILESDTAFQTKVEEETANRSASRGRRKRKHDGEEKGVEKKSVPEVSEAAIAAEVKVDAEVANTGRRKRRREEGDKEIEKVSTSSSATVTATPRRRKVSEISDMESSKKEEEDRKEKTLSRKKRGDAGGEEEESDKKDMDTTPLASLRKKVIDDLTPNDASSRERKKSKYLSPPYTSSIGWKTRKSENSGGLVSAGGNDSGPREMTDELRNAIEFLRLGPPPKEVRDQMYEVARSPQFPKDESLDELTREFFCIYRSFMYLKGANSEVLEEGSLEEENEAGKAEKKNEMEEKLSARKKKKKKDGRAELLIVFGEGSDLPNKDDLIKLYKKFGTLDEERTEMLYMNMSARVAFMNEADAETAFESSRKKSPFATSSSVNFRVKYVKKKKKSDSEYVKEKLEEMRAMVDRGEGGMTEEVRMKLEVEMRELLEKVGKMTVVGSSSS